MLTCVRFPTTNPYLNLATEEYFLLHHEKKKSDLFLFFYENSDSIILGRSLDYDAEIYAHKHHPPVLRRLSGGGTVSHFAGNLNYGILLSLDTYAEYFAIRESYEKVLAPVIRGLSPWVKVEQRGLSDLAVLQQGSYRKLSGNSQVRKRGWLLHHGTVLFDQSLLRQIDFYLRMPAKQPDYRHHRPHHEFMIKALPFTNRGMIIRSLALAFAEEFATTPRFVKLVDLLGPAALKTVRADIMPSYLNL